jgi:hypothetical protein
MDIKYFAQFIGEKLYDTPESYVSQRLDEIERKIRLFFSTGDEEEEVENFEQRQKKEKEIQGKMTLSELGITLDSISKSKYSKIQDNIKCKFSDEGFLYDLTIILDLKECMTISASKLLSKDEQVGLCILYSYDYMYLTHICISELLDTGIISETNMSNLRSIIF